MDQEAWEDLLQEAEALPSTEEALLFLNRHLQHDLLYAFATLLSRGKAFTHFEASDHFNSSQGKRGMACLAAALHHNTSLLTLQLDYESWPRLSLDISPLAQSLAVNDTLKELSLVNDGIGNAQVRDLAEALCHNHALAVLNLSQNEIGPAGGGYLAVMIAKTSSLETLILDYNPIQPGAQALARALVGNRSLCTFSMVHTGTTSGVLGEFAHVLRENMTLRRLKLAGNVADLPTMHLVADNLLKNHTLVRLDMHDEGATLMERAGNLECTCTHKLGSPGHLRMHKMARGMRGIVGELRALRESIQTRCAQNRRRVFTLDSLQKGCAVRLAETYSPEDPVWAMLPSYVENSVQCMYAYAFA